MFLFCLVCLKGYIAGKITLPEHQQYLNSTNFGIQEKFRCDKPDSTKDALNLSQGT